MVGVQVIVMVPTEVTGVNVKAVVLVMEGVLVGVLVLVKVLVGEPGVHVLTGVLVREGI